MPYAEGPLKRTKAFCACWVWDRRLTSPTNEDNAPRSLHMDGIVGLLPHADLLDWRVKKNDLRGPFFAGSSLGSSTCYE